MTRKDYETLQMGMGDALHQLRHTNKSTLYDGEVRELAFWRVVETLEEYLQLNNRAFDGSFFKEEILRYARIGDNHAD